MTETDVALPVEEVPRICGAEHRFKAVPGCRAANVLCPKPAGHPFAHEVVRGSTVYAWSDPKPENTE